jgi:hypothetical protein
LAIRASFVRVVIPPAWVTKICPVCVPISLCCSSVSGTSWMCVRIGGTPAALSRQPYVPGLVRKIDQCESER